MKCVNGGVCEVCTLVECVKCTLVKCVECVHWRSVYTCGVCEVCTLVECVHCWSVYTGIVCTLV